MKLTAKHYGILVLGLFTAVMHLLAAVDKILFPDGPDPLFLLNGLGYIGLLGAYFLPIPFFQQRHKLVRSVLIGYVILTIVAWIFIWVIQYVIIQGTPFFSHDSLYGVPSKIAEVILLFLLRSDKPA
jgi:hypothetical protein